MKISNSDRPNVKAECLRLLVSLKLDPARMQLISGFVDTYLRLNQAEEQLFQSQLNTMKTQDKEQIMELTTSWKEEGIVQGGFAIVGAWSHPPFSVRLGSSCFVCQENKSRILNSRLKISRTTGDTVSPFV